jgi:hypothetical protein
MNDTQAGLEFQSCAEANKLLVGRTLECWGTTSPTKTGRPQGVCFRDIKTGEVIGIFASFGALEAHIIPLEGSDG